MFKMFISIAISLTTCFSGFSYNINQLYHTVKDFHVNATDNWEQVESDLSLSDEKIMQILSIYHSNAQTGRCNGEGVHISQTDIEEFKQYYATAYSMFPDDYDHYFKMATTWISRNGEISLSCYYKEDGMFLRGSNMNAQAANVANAFRLLKEKHQISPHWDNTASMEAQFHCHAATIGKLKYPWNIEPWRTESSLPIVIIKGCNP